MGKVLRRGETAEVEKTLTKLGIPILYRLHDNGTAEGGGIIHFHFLSYLFFFFMKKTNYITIPLTLVNGI